MKKKTLLIAGVAALMIAMTAVAMSGPMGGGMGMGPSMMGGG